MTGEKTVSKDSADIAPHDSGLTREINYIRFFDGNVQARQVVGEPFEKGDLDRPLSGASPLLLAFGLEAQSPGERTIDDAATRAAVQDKPLRCGAVDPDSNEDLIAH